MWQHARDGSKRPVEAACYNLELAERQVLAVAVHDVSDRRAAQTQLLEKQQQLDHLAHHDQLTGLPNRLYLAAHLPEAIARGEAPQHRRSRCCSSTSTASSTSTTRAATRPATSC